MPPCVPLPARQCAVMCTTATGYLSAYHSCAAAPPAVRIHLESLNSDSGYHTTQPPFARAPAKPRAPVYNVPTRHQPGSTRHQPGSTRLQPGNVPTPAPTRPPFNTGRHQPGYRSRHHPGFSAAPSRLPVHHRHQRNPAPCPTPRPHRRHHLFKRPTHPASHSSCSTPTQPTVTPASTAIPAAAPSPAPPVNPVPRHAVGPHPTHPPPGPAVTYSGYHHPAACSWFNWLLLSPPWPSAPHQQPTPVPWPTAPSS